MAYQQNPVFNGAIPGEGAKAVPVILDFTNGTNQSIDLQTLLQMGNISNVQSIYVDNFSNAGDITLTTEITNQGITFPANTCGYYPLLVTTNVTFNFFCANATRVRVHFLNYPIAASVWPQGGGNSEYPDPPPSDGVYYVFRNGAWVANPIQTDAPSDGNRYARLNGAWSNIGGLYLPLAGNTSGTPMLGTIYMNNNSYSTALRNYANGVACFPWVFGDGPTTTAWATFVDATLNYEFRRYVASVSQGAVWSVINSTGQATFNLYGTAGPNIYGSSSSLGALRIGTTAHFLWNATAFAPNSNGTRSLGGSSQTWSNVYSVLYSVVEGANAKQGIATLAAGTVTVNNTSVTANSRIQLTIQDPNGGTPGAVYISARTAGTSFTITSTSNTDTSIVAYTIFEPA